MSRKIHRRDFLKTTGLGVAAVALPGCANLAIKPGQTKGRRPNILFLFTDDQRFDTIGALNNPEVHTPNLDRLVRRGTTFTHAFIQGSTVGAVCVCSRAMLLTGKSLWRSIPEGRKPYGNESLDGMTLWPEVFRQAGYRTFGTGKWHNGRHSYARSFTGGGNIFFGGMSDHLAVPINDFDPTGSYAQEDRRMGEKFSSVLFSDAAVEFIKGRKGIEQPFFAYVSYTAPHDPRMAPKEFADLYPPEKIALPPNFLPEHPFDNGDMRLRDEKLAPWPRTPAIVREHMAAYYAMITHVDAQIGRVLQALEESGQADNTLIIFTGDNGLAVGQHGLLGKQNLYDHSVRVPMILAGPMVPPGKSNDALVCLYDLFPTSCELAGLESHADVEARSLAPLIAGQSARVRDVVLLAYRHFQRGIRTRDWKLITYNVAGRQHTQLFNVSRDPWEMNNLAEAPGYQDKVKELTALLKRELASTGDPLDLNLPNWGYVPPEEG